MIDPHRPDVSRDELTCQPERIKKRYWCGLRLETGEVDAVCDYFHLRRFDATGDVELAKALRHRHNLCGARRQQSLCSTEQPDRETVGIRADSD